MNTREAAMELGVTVSAVNSALSQGKFKAPKKNDSGYYTWTLNDILNAAEYFKNIERSDMFQMEPDSEPISKCKKENVSTIKNIKSINISMRILFREDVTALEKIILGLIETFGGINFDWSDEAIGRLIKIRTRSVSRIISRLDKKQLIFIESKRSKHRKISLS